MVRHLIEENNLDPATIQGTGVGGRITRSDVLSVLDQIAGAGCGAVAGAGCGAGAGAGCGAGAGAGCGAGAGAGCGAGADEASPTLATTTPTATVSPSGTTNSLTTPEAVAGTSESTLSVETSNKG
ncbi:E3 binding domain-containing protein [Ferrimicrobium acidiphilum]|uniref:E3 binding domain-containing protein n=1 Tax=Ferrimicrobium acidiphilum TaxID=121039 RepID=UPI0023F0AA53|nr:E3 binding domain-containing protein [Ferrimicrobium acidiphilum]